MVIDAFPPPRLAVPSIVLPSVNVTDPVAAEGATVAVNVTAVLNVEGLADEANVTVEFALLTVWVSAEDVPLLQLPSPM